MHGGTNRKGGPAQWGQGSGLIKGIFFIVSGPRSREQTQFSYLSNMNDICLMEVGVGMGVKKVT